MPVPDTGKKVVSEVEVSLIWFTSSFAVHLLLLTGVFNGILHWSIFSRKLIWFKSTEERIFLIRAEF